LLLVPASSGGLHKFVSDHDSNLLKYNATVREKMGVSGSQAVSLKEEINIREKGYSKEG